MYSVLSNPLSKLKGGPSATPRFLRGSSLTRFLSSLSLSVSLFFSFSFGEAHIYYRLVTVTAFIMPWLWSSCQIHCGAFFLLVLCQRMSCGQPRSRHKTPVFHTKQYSNAQGGGKLKSTHKLTRFMYLMHVYGLTVNESWVDVILMKNVLCNLLSNCDFPLSTSSRPFRLVDKCN